MRVLCFIVIASLVAIAAATGPILVARKSMTALERRSASRWDIAPKGTIVLEYAITPQHPPTAAVTIHAYDEKPIILVEDFDRILSGVSCSGYVSSALWDVIAFDFIDEPAFALAAQEWATIQGSFVITCHAGCNANGERGAWRVITTVPDFSTLRMNMIVEPVEMRYIAKSFGVTYNHGGGQVPAQRGPVGLWRRAYESGLHPLLPFGFHPAAGPRFPLFPPNTTLNDATANNVSQLTDAQIALTCADCMFSSNVTIGLNFDVDVINPSCTNATQPCSTFTNFGMNLTLDHFQQEIELELAVAEGIQASESYKILEVLVGPGLILPTLINLGPSVGIKIAFDLAVTSDINFTYGAVAHVADGAFATIDLLNPIDGSFDPTFSATGWDTASVDQIPFRVNAGELDIATSIALSPYAEVSLEILGLGGGALRLVTNMPQVAINASLEAGVNRACNPVGEDDFESFGTAFVVASGMALSTTTEYDDMGLLSFGFPQSADYMLFEKDIPFTPALGINKTSCFVLADDDSSANAPSAASSVASSVASSAASSAVMSGASPVASSASTSPTVTGVPKTTGTLLAAQSAVPTWDFSKIASYSSANGKLPTNVNYTQMVQATSVPPNLQAAVTKAASSRKSSSGGSPGAADGAAVLGHMFFGIASIIALVALL
ncbi:hypothetical protein PsYK624_012400 [Phanerochaete sordida]|uniref:DUF7029 domain-containing protein n=1 Tax=Phanerochaete sordida TaxID=48140 RepID=A0A9P3FXT9_9APHY|nr:hypothetical protein PsYK624_012400 [Phanerochaete sordida]